VDPARFWKQDGRVYFEVVLDVADRRAEEMRVGPAVQAAWRLRGRTAQRRLDHAFRT